MNNWSHIILDEVHEREEDMDLVMLLCKKLLGTNSRGTKLVLMSATLNDMKLRQYFSSRVVGFGKVDAPSLILGQEVVHQKVVSTLHYEAVCDMLGQTDRTPFHLSRPALHWECVLAAKKLLASLDWLEERDGKSVGGVLIFLPGIQEITTLRDHLMDERDGVEHKTKWSVLPLHSRIPWEEQSRVFSPAPDRARKIVLSTNIAESSITVTDIRYVIDFGLTKNVEVERETNYPMLVLDWASRSQLIQRSGRAGRVDGDGRVYVLLPQTLVSRLPSEHVPEIQRIPLTKVVLDVKQLDMGSPKQLLELAVDPPKNENLIQSIQCLKEMRALMTTVKGVTVKDDGDMTVLGEIVAKLPIDVKLGKLIILGHIFGVLEEAIIIAAGLNGKSIFSSPFDARLQTYKNKLYWADRSFNDCFSILHAYSIWLRRKNRGDFKMRNMEEDFCRTSFLQKNQLTEMKILVDEINISLKGMDIDALKYDCVNWEGETRDFILQIVMFGAFYPNYFTKQSSSQVAIDANKLLDGRNVRNTVYLQGMKNSQSKVGELYTRQIKNLLRECTKTEENILVSFEGKKIFVEFEESGGSEDRNRNYQGPGGNMTGDILHQVYIALKMSQLGGRLPLDLYPDDVAQSKMRECEQASQQQAVTTLNVDQVKPPLIGTESLVIKGLAHVSSPNLFWVYYGENALKDLKKIEGLIKEFSSVCPPVISAGHVKVGSVYLAPSLSAGDTLTYERARIVGSSGEKCSIFSIDYGHSGEVHWRELRQIPSSVLRSSPELMTVPGLALQSSLSGVRPDRLRSGRGLWAPSVVDQFRRMLEARDKLEMTGHVFSVTRSVADPNMFVLNLDTLHINSNDQDVEIKQKLLKKNLADLAPESFRSQNDHRERMRFAAYSAEMQQFLKEGYFNPTAPKLDIGTVKEDPSQLRERIGLQGPFSPLQHKIMCQYRVGSFRMTNIDPDSVNSVLLDQNPTDTEERWLVAGMVGISSNGEAQYVRNTFWLPDKPGIGALLTMLFAPQVELRHSKDQDKLTGFIAGLGPQVKETGMGQVEKKRTSGYFSEHDMEIKFNVEVDQQDIDLVNNIRHWLNKMLLKTKQGAMTMTLPIDLRSAQQGIKTNLLSLLNRERRLVSREGVKSGHEYW